MFGSEVPLTPQYLLSLGHYEAIDDIAGVCVYDKDRSIGYCLSNGKRVGRGLSFPVNVSLPSASSSPDFLAWCTARVPHAAGVRLWAAYGPGSVHHRLIRAYQAQAQANLPKGPAAKRAARAQSCATTRLARSCPRYAPGGAATSLK